MLHYPLSNTKNARFEEIENLILYIKSTIRQRVVCSPSLSRGRSAPLFLALLCVTLLREALEYFFRDLLMRKTLRNNTNAAFAKNLESVSKFKRKASEICITYGYKAADGYFSIDRYSEVPARRAAGGQGAERADRARALPAAGPAERFLGPLKILKMLTI